MKLPDTGGRQEFSTGAVREADPSKPAVEGISPFAIMRLGLLMTKAAAKYGNYRNWEKGIPVTRFIGAIIRHAFFYLARETKEDHLAAVMWNAMCLMHYEDAGTTTGTSFTELDDRPKWSQTKEPASEQAKESSKPSRCHDIHDGWRCDDYEGHQGQHQTAHGISWSRSKEPKLCEWQGGSGRCTACRVDAVKHPGKVPQPHERGCTSFVAAPHPIERDAQTGDSWCQFCCLPRRWHGPDRS